MNKKVLSIALVSMMSLGIFAGCGGADDSSTGEVTTAPAGDDTTVAEKTTIPVAGPTSINVVTSYGGDDGNRKNYETAFKAYEAATGNTVKDASGTANEDWKVKITTDFELGAEPDVIFYFNGNDSDTFVKNKKFVSVDKIRESYPDYASNMKDELLGASPVDGVNYSIPVNGFWESMFVNETVIAEAGVTLPGTDYDWTKFLADCEAIKAKGKTPISCSLFEMPNYWFEYTTYNYSTPAAFNTVPASIDEELGQAWVKGLKDVTDLYNKGYFPKNTLTATDPETNTLMIQDKAAFMIDGSWKVGYFAENKAGDALDTISMAFPPSNGNSRKTTDLVGGISMGYFITEKAYNDPAKQKACVDFVSAMTTDEVVFSFCGAGNLTATVTPLPDAPNANSLEKKVTVMNTKVTGVSTGAVEDKLDAKTTRAEFVANYKNVVTGKMTAEDSVTTVLKSYADFMK